MTSSKSTYHQGAKARLVKVRTIIIELEVTVGNAEAGIKVRYDQKMNQIRGQFAQATKKLDELEKETQDSWTDLRSGIDEAINALSEAVDTISQHIRIQPEE